MVYIYYEYLPGIYLNPSQRLPELGDLSLDLEEHYNRVQGYSYPIVILQLKRRDKNGMIFLTHCKVLVNLEAGLH